ncbi:MAG: universal stress protein [Saprospiraceae bacterium]|nr:universal stress protein [Saprospiraceae bacterium]
MILVPTDFSEIASAACDLAIRIAVSKNDPLHFIHCLRKGGQLTASEHQEVEHNLRMWKSKAEEAGAQASLEVIRGNLIEKLSDLTEQKSSNLVVMGSHGISGKEEYLIGSNTQKAIRKIEKPILVVKGTVSNFPFRNVVYASSFEKRDEADFMFFINWVKEYQPTIHLLAIMQSAMDHYRELCRPLSCQTHFFRDINVEAGIRHFSEENQIDLIAVSNSQKKPVKRLLSGSTVEFLVNHAERPVLSIDGVSNK